MSDLKEYLGQELSTQIVKLQQGINSTKKSLHNLNETELDNAHYIVKLHSLWEKEGESSTRTNHTGNLQSAILTAEKEFKDTNNRGDIQANYQVLIQLGQNEYNIPQKFWEKYKER